jgi:hypothetical protein
MDAVFATVRIADVHAARDVFGTREYASQAAAYPPPPLPGVTQLTQEIREVYASA